MKWVVEPTKSSSRTADPNLAELAVAVEDVGLHLLDERVGVLAAQLDESLGHRDRHVPVDRVVALQVKVDVHLHAAGEREHER